VTPSADARRSGAASGGARGDDDERRVHAQQRAVEAPDPIDGRGGVVENAIGARVRGDDPRAARRRRGSA